jgi:hypothetical protein
MEWVKVAYANTRDVFIDGRRSGETNRVIAVAAGTHEFHLGAPLDYAPDKQKVAVKNTSIGNPLQIDFK